MIRSGELGRDPQRQRPRVAGLAATRSQGTWREDPALSGGGFMFDTGAHMLNTVADLAGEDVVEVAAWLEDDGEPGRRPGRRAWRGWRPAR